LNATITSGVVAWVLAALCGYLFLRRTLYNLLDPLLIVNIAIPFSAALLAVLCTTEVVSWDKFTLFAVVLLTYLVGGRAASAFFGRESFRQTIGTVLSSIRESEVSAVVVITVAITLVVAVLGVQAGAEGDARFAFSRLFRPILLVQNGLFLFSLVLLLAPKVPAPRAWLWILLLLVLSIPFSGKSVLLPAVFWFGIKLYVQRSRVRLRTVLWSLLVVVLGVTIMGLLAYRTSSAATAILLFTNRLWMSGDVYIFAYQRDALASIHSNYPVSFLAYVMHPITSLAGIRGYDKPLGSMLASEVAGDDILTGPNPQLPVVLDYFFPDTYTAILPLAFVTGFLVIGIRPLGMFIASRARNRYAGLGGIVAAIFAPAAGFLDTSLVVIALVGIVAATVLLVVIELLRPGSRAPPSQSNRQAAYISPASPPHISPTSTS
jgi:hypothetical protein